MKETSAYIERVRQVNAHYQHLELAAVDDALRKIKPGQSLLARLIDRNPEVEQWDPYLREHWWPIGFTPANTLLIERPTTQRYEPGQFLSLIGPIGEHYKFRKSLRNVLLLAYDSVPTPLTVMTPLLLKNGISVTLILLGRARQYDTAHLPPEIEVIRGDDRLNWEGQVMTLGWADQMFVTVNPDDELFRFGEVVHLLRERRNGIADNYVFGIFQPPLPCGVGACSACMLRLKEGFQAVCTKGPAFDLTLLHLPG
ncbi:MAG: hypothetical protein MUE40_05870 [Anaerolineae bacterium]|jgi:hypothetical protein|nr:hypothetical protein [Anaerolineae bacterium]